jgi:hypothetical protein
MDAPRVSMGRWPTSVYTGPGDTRLPRPCAPIIRVSSSHPTPDIGLTMRPMRVPVLRVLCGQCLVADDERILGILLLGCLGEGRVGHRRGIRRPDPFPLAPLRTGREPFSSSGSPVSACLHGWTAGRDPRGCCESSPSTFTDDPQNCLGVPHLAYLTSLKGLEHLPPFAL